MVKRTNDETARLLQQIDDHKLLILQIRDSNVPCKASDGLVPVAEAKTKQMLCTKLSNGLTKIGLLQSILSFLRGRGEVGLIAPQAKKIWCFF